MVYVHEILARLHEFEIHRADLRRHGGERLSSRARDKEAAARHGLRDMDRHRRARRGRCRHRAVQRTCHAAAPILRRDAHNGDNRPQANLGPLNALPRAEIPEPGAPPPKYVSGAPLSLSYICNREQKYIRHNIIIYM